MAKLKLECIAPGTNGGSLYSLTWEQAGGPFPSDQVIQHVHHALWPHGQGVKILGHGAAGITIEVPGMLNGSKGDRFLEALARHLNH